jgi:hypothetical protein
MPFFEPLPKIIRRIIDRPLAFPGLSRTTLESNIRLCHMRSREHRDRWRDNHPEQRFLPEPRRGTRINCKIPLTLTSLNPADPFSEPGVTLLVNPQGCAARFGRPVEIGTAIRLDGLPVSSSVTARVVNCIRVGDYEKFWILGLMLDEPGNVWGIESPPEDWHRSSSLMHSPASF